MNTNQARMIDPILTKHAQGYIRPAAVGHMLFPRVTVEARGGTVIEFGKEAFKRYNTRRSPGANTKRVQYGHSGKQFALLQDALEATVPYEWMEDAKRVPGIDLGRRAITTTSDTIANSLEIEQAEKAMDPSNYASGNKITLSGSSIWSDKGNSDPVGDVENAKEAVRKKIGIEPNTAVFSATKWKEFKNHPDVIARFAAKDGQKVTVTTDMAAELLELEHVVVGKGVYADDNGEMKDIWGNGVVIAYVAHQTTGAEQPSYGYTYELRGYPLVENPYEDRSAKSWIYPVTHERAAVLSGMEAGYLITE